MMKYTITTLVENTASADSALMTEYGLSFLIEAGNNRILFDTGQGTALLHNANALHIDLTQIDSVVLSHGHIDHAGGLTQVIAQNSTITLYAHPKVFENKLYATDIVGENKSYVAIGVADEKAAIEGSGIRMMLSDRSIQLVPGIITSGYIPMNTSYETIEPGFYVGNQGCELSDPIEDDLALILDTDEGTVVVLGCTHRGIINTLKQVVKLTGKQKIHAVMGGLHLLHADAEKLTWIINELEPFAIDYLIVGHCTGHDAIERLRGVYGDSLVLNTVGLIQHF